MNTPKDLHPYQNKAINFILEKKKCALFLEMGMGKTVISLTVISKLLDQFSISKILIIGPLRVVNNVWHEEISKWSHLNHLSYSIVTGNEKERLKALEKKSDIYLINRENIYWLYSIKKINWDLIVIDESSSFKSSSSKRFKSLKKFNYEYMIELTGTPSPNGYLDLWSQIFLLDKGERLGSTFNVYKELFFFCDYYGYNYTPISRENILNKISDITLSMGYEDYIQLPDKIELVTKVKLPLSQLKLYNEIKKEFTANIGNTEITIFNAATLSNKLLQFCNGAIYDEDKNIIEIHNTKLDALEELIEDNPNENILVAYNYKSDLIRLQKRFKHAVVIDKDGKNIDLWNKGKIKLLLCHPASSGKGLNLQHGGHIIIWFGLTWNLEDYLQFNARLHRIGQLKPVIINHIIVENCIDEIIMKVLNNKNIDQNILLNALKKV
jgi:SNF2 family DNA or RNA helicase